jgi:hypothetical protein
MKVLKYTVFLAMAAVIAVASIARAGETITVNPYFAILSEATAAELPAKSADLVSKADAKQRQRATVDVVSAAVSLNPAAAPAIIGSIAQASPDMAAIAAATAVGLVPDQAAIIAHAAAAAAPTKAGKIVEAICRLLPKDYQQIADAVAEVVPGAGKEILTAISAAIPTMKASLNQVLAGYNGNVPSVSSVLDQVKSSALVATTTSLTYSPLGSPLLAPPTVGPPYVPSPTGHTNLNPGSGGQVPTGGRNYAAP